MPEESTEQVGVWTLTVSEDCAHYVRATDGTRTFELGQEVVANGRFGATKGTVGVILRIIRPWENGRTTNFLAVEFPRQRAISMKPKDLEFQGGKPC